MVGKATDNDDFDMYCLFNLYVFQSFCLQVIQRRVNGSEDFFRGWNDYKSGFGQLDHEFWLGMQFLYSIVTWIYIFVF